MGNMMSFIEGRTAAKESEMGFMGLEVFNYGFQDDKSSLTNVKQQLGNFQKHFHFS